MFSSSGRRSGPTAAWRLSIGTTVAFAVGTAIAFLIVYTVIAAGIHERSDTWLKGETQTLAQVVESSPAGTNDEALIEEIAEIASHEVPLDENAEPGGERPIFFLVASDEDPAELWAGPRNRAPFLEAVRGVEWRPGIARSIDVSGWEHPFRVVCRESADGRLVFLGFFDVEAHALLHKVQWTFVLLWLGMVVFGFGVSSFSAWRILQRVEDITGTAAEIGSHGLDRRVPVGTVRDEISRLAFTFNGMLDRIEDSVSRIRGVTDEIAHDLRSPLTAIRGNLELALTSGREDDVQDVLAATIDELDRLRRIINTSLDVAEADAGALRVDRKATDLARLTARMVDVYRPAAEEQGLELEVDVAGDIVADIDPDLVGRALANLVDNALQHLPPGCHVRVSARAENGDAILEVADDGPGFSPEVRERALERFVRGRGSSGSGLGLALVNAAAQAHGGDVRILDSPQGGAAVCIRLPPAFAAES